MALLAITAGDVVVTTVAAAAIGSAGFGGRDLRERGVRTGGTEVVAHGAILLEVGIAAGRCRIRYELGTGIRPWRERSSQNRPCLSTDQRIQL